MYDTDSPAVRKMQFEIDRLKAQVEELMQLLENSVPKVDVDWSKRTKQSLRIVEVPDGK
jgi:hypothetical protein